MSRRLPPLNALKAFEAAARHLSFTRSRRAVRDPGSHQPPDQGAGGVSRHQAVSPQESLPATDRGGQSYFLDIKDIFASISEATDKLLARSARGAHRLLQPSFAIQWLVPRLVKFSERHPDIDVRIKAVDMDEGR